MSRLRIAGIALLVAAALAAVVGLLSLGSRGGGISAARSSPPPASSQPGPGPASPGPSAPGSAAPSQPFGPPQPSRPTQPLGPGSSAALPPGSTSIPGAPGQPGEPGQPAQPGPGAGPVGQQPGSGGQALALHDVPVRVYNNSTIRGLAERAAADLRNAGWTVTEVGNYPFGTIPTTTAYYRPGTDEQPAAQEIAAEFGIRAEPRFAGIRRASPGIIVIVTNDYRGGAVK